MSNETRWPIDYWLSALATNVRDALRIVEASALPETYHVGMLLRRMRGDIGLLAALIRETQKDATPVRRRRKRRDIIDASAPTARKVRKPRAKRNAEPTTPTEGSNP